MNFIIGFFLGRWIGTFFYSMFAHPILFLIGLVRFVLVLAAIGVGVLVPLWYGGSAGWAWFVFPILIALFLLFVQRKIRDWAEGL